MNPDALLGRHDDSSARERPWLGPAQPPNQWDRLRHQEETRRAREGHLYAHPAFAGLMACSGQDESWVCWLLRSDSSGVTPLMKASMASGGACARLLLPYESPHARDSRGMTALMVAAERGNAEVCALLAPLSPLAARNLQGQDALALARSPSAEAAILLVMALQERALIEPEALLADDQGAERGSKGRL